MNGHSENGLPISQDLNKNRGTIMAWPYLPTLAISEKKLQFFVGGVTFVAKRGYGECLNL